MKQLDEIVNEFMDAINDITKDYERNHPDKKREAYRNHITAHYFGNEAIGERAPQEK